jgi:hypothetical protein
MRGLLLVLVQTKGWASAQYANFVHRVTELLFLLAIVLLVWSESASGPWVRYSTLSLPGSSDCVHSRIRWCTYPQEIGFAFDDGPVTLEYVQILSHQFKIAQRVELYVGMGHDYDSASYQRLGYVMSSALWFTGFCGP